MLSTWLEQEAATSVAITRELLYEKAQRLFAIVVGQVWFSEFSSLDENSLVLTADGLNLTCKVEMKEIKVAI
jgi:hypothetical protein